MRERKPAARRPVCMPPGVRLEANVNLLVAALDLKMVRLVRAAMNGGDDGHDLGRHEKDALIKPRQRIEPEPRFEPRKRIEPEPRFEPRPVHRPSEPIPPACPDCCPAATSADATGGTSSTSPIEPPWKVLPWEREPEPRPRPIQRVKVVTGRPDLSGKGNVIDLFI